MPPCIKVLFIPALVSVGGIWVDGVVLCASKCILQMLIVIKHSISLKKAQMADADFVI